MSKLTNLETFELILSYNSLNTNKVSSSLGEMLLKFDKLRSLKLDLSDSDINEEAINDICEKLSYLPNLRYLELSLLHLNI